MDPTDQSDFGVRFGWGPGAAAVICHGTRVSVIVDVLSFTTAVEIAVSRGAVIHPFRWQDERAAETARRLGAVLATERWVEGDEEQWSLSPASLAAIPAGTELLLPSPNGAAITLVAAEGCDDVIAGCLRNASAVAAAAAETGGPIAVIAAGERWPDGQLRVAVEDLIGAGAIIGGLIERGVERPSPEARAAAAAYSAMAPDLESALLDCVSGRELVARDFGQDVVLAAALDVSTTVPRFRDGAFRP